MFDYKKLAATKLCELRHNKFQGFFDSWVGHMRTALRDGGLSLADIGTSEAEIQSLRLTWRKRNAVLCLQQLRQNQNGTHAETCLSQLQRELGEAELLSTDIGSSAEEMRTLTKQVHLARAKRWLETYRAKKIDIREYMYHKTFKDSFASANLSPADIGMTHDEAKALRLL